MKELLTRLIEGTVILGMVWLLAGGCATFKGVAHDVSWTADKIDQSITIPE